MQWNQGKLEMKINQAAIQDHALWADLHILNFSLFNVIISVLNKAWNKAGYEAL